MHLLNSRSLPAGRCICRSEGSPWKLRCSASKPSRCCRLDTVTPGQPYFRASATITFFAFLTYETRPRQGYAFSHEARARSSCRLQMKKYTNRHRESRQGPKTACTKPRDFGRWDSDPEPRGTLPPTPTTTSVLCGATVIVGWRPHGASIAPGGAHRERPHGGQQGRPESRGVPVCRGACPSAAG